MAKNEVRVTITGDAQGLRSALGQAEGQLGGFGDRMQALGGKLRDVGQTMTLGLTLPIVGALGLGVKWAGELEDAQAMSQQVFGSMSSQMDAWASNSAQAFGLSSGDAIEWANQMGIRLRQIGGMSEETAATTSQNLVQLAGDFASAFGGSVDEAAQALGSALTGEFEPLKRYGVVINDAALKQKLFEMTGKEVKGTLSAQEKQMATLALITEQASLVQGDYGRNAEGATNSQRTMIAALKDAGTTLGTVLLPFVTKAAQFVSDLASRFQGLDPTIQRVVVIAGVVVAALGPVIYVAGLLATAIGFIASPVGLVVAAIAALVAAFVYFYNTNEGFRDWVNGVVSAVRDGLVAAFNWFVDNVVPKLVQAFEFLRDTVFPAVVSALSTLIDGHVQVWHAVQQAWDWITEKASQAALWFNTHVAPTLSAAFDLIVTVNQRLYEVFSTVWSAIQPIVSVAMDFIRGYIEVGLGFIRAIWDGAFQAMRTVVSAVWDAIRGVIEGALQVIRGIIQFVTGVITGDWSGALEGLRNIATGAWNAISSVITGAINVIRGLVSGIGAFFTSAWDGPLARMRDGVSSVFDGIISFVSGIPGRIVRALGSLGELLYNAGRSVIEGLARGITDRIQGVYDFVSGIAGRIQSLKGPLEYDRKLLIPAGRAIMGGLRVGLIDGFDDVQKMVGTIAPDITTTVGVGAPGPQAVMAGAGGPSITVNVTAGVGDPSEIGRQVVDTIRAYEQRNGTYWRN